MNNRDMFYGNYQAGGFSEPNFNMGMPNNFQPQGYNINANYQAFGPNVIPGASNNSNNTYGYSDDYDQRITKLERQIRRIDQRLRKLENSSTVLETEINDYTDIHMI